MTYALDTKTITFFLKENERARQNADAAFDAGHDLIIPKIVDYEVQRGLVAGRMDRKLREYMAFRETVEVGAISDEVWQKAVQVYATLSQQGKPIGDGDVLVAAFCFTIQSHNQPIIIAWLSPLLFRLIYITDKVCVRHKMVTQPTEFALFII